MILFRLFHSLLVLAASLMLAPQAYADPLNVLCQEEGSESHPGSLEVEPVIWTQTGDLLGFLITAPYFRAHYAAVVGFEHSLSESSYWRGHTAVDAASMYEVGIVRNYNGSVIPGQERYQYVIHCYAMPDLCNRVNNLGQAVLLEAFFRPTTPIESALDSKRLRCIREVE